MFHSNITSHHTRIWGQIGLAILMALALATSAHAFPITDTANNQAQGCEGDPELCLRWGPDYASKAVPVTGIRNHSDFANNQAQNCESLYSEMCLHLGPDYAAAAIPVTGSSSPSDFSYNYWLVVGPAGEQPVR